MTKKILSAPDEPKQKTLNDFKLSTRKIRRYIKKLNLSRDEYIIALGLMGKGYRAERLLWSDNPGRYRGSKTLARMMVRHHRAAPAGRTYYMLTFNDDCGFTSDRVPHLAIQQTIDKVRRAVAGMGLHAFVMLEVHPLMNFPGGGAGRSLLLGAHAIAWSDQPFDHVRKAAALCASPAWRCTLGADPVHISVIAPNDLARVSHYLMKQRPDTKNLMPNKHKPGQLLMMDTTEGYRDEFAVRLFEGQSQVELMNVMFGVGDGSVIRQALRTEIVQWHRKRTSAISVRKDVDVWAFWQRLRQSHGSKRFLPYRYDGCAIKPRVVIHRPCVPDPAPQPTASVVDKPTVSKPAAARPDTDFLGEAIAALVAKQADAQSGPRTSRGKRKRIKPPEGRAKRPNRKILGPRRD